MNMRPLFIVLFIAAPTSAADTVDYLREVKPIFERRCYACHAALKQKSGLRLDTAKSAVKGSDSGAVIEPGKPDDSRLIELVTSSGDDRMPPKDQGTPLSTEEIDLVRRWIAQGATGPADEKPQTDPREYWSYRLVKRPALPVINNPAWARNPIDNFIAAEHQKRGLARCPEAPREVWLRRVFLDLVGLPPSRDELHAFLKDDSSDAYERVVDGLLARPEYGQRWGRHWMDVWRYSDWYGSRAINEIRYSQRHIWRWRDWIVDSLNGDKPYDRMVIEVLAGDEVAPNDPEALRATGFIGRNWYKFDRNVWMFDVVEHTSQAFLGLTLRCARCHDHKYDPISQEDYYRFRAFFEPHDVRTDPLAADAPTEKDATLGMVLKEGLARVFDKQLDVPTYLFQRGDNRYPDEKRPLTAGVPAALGNDQLDIQQVSLPAEAFYPALKPYMIESLIVQGAANVQKAEQEIEVARAAAAAAQHKVDELAARIAKGNTTGSPDPAPAFVDDFTKARPEGWKTISGQWVYENGRLVQKSVQNFATIVSAANHPKDFKARWKYRPLADGNLRSIGFSFDYLDQGNSQDIYTHVNDASQGIQAFHRLGGAQSYPPAGIVKTTSLKVGEVATVEIIVHGLQLTIWLNGEKQLDYVLPIPRRKGKFALWAHLGTVEFQELEIRELIPTLEDLKRDQQIAADSIKQSEQKLATVRAELESVKARVAAEKAKYSGGADADVKNMALTASRAERAVAAAKAAETVLQAEQQLARVQAAAKKGAAEAAPPSQSPPSPAVVEAEKKLAEARHVQTTALAAMENPDGKYALLGEQFPATSTGRRTALARWIASPQNPRTARVAVNHIWLRHFGQGLVPTVENFGLNGQPPTYRELLDWLAVELVENGWRMKPIHKLIVLSATYRMVSTDGAADPSNRRIDRDNRYLWRMNSRRLEAEAVRDSVLATAGTLDTKLGGPEIPEAEGQTVLRRSMYFRLTPNEKMKFLELFDVADPNACYRRRESVVPQQALALMNSAMALDQGRALAEKLTKEAGDRDEEPNNIAFIVAAFEQVLSRSPTADEKKACLTFLQENAKLVQGPGLTAFPAGGQAQRAPAAQPHLRARENLVHVLFSHNDFVTVR